MCGTRLQGTNLMYANLLHAHLHNAQFDAETTLPNGGKWTPETDMRQFTHPEEYETD